MSKANDRQVGGDHYSVAGTKLQHWDVARIFNFDPMQYQITKHVFRWKDKFKSFPERLADLAKAEHYLQKYIEDAVVWDNMHVRLPAVQLVIGPRDQAAIDIEWEAQQDAAVRFEPDGFTKDGTRYQCKVCRKVVLARSPLGADDQHPPAACQGFQEPSGSASERSILPGTKSGAVLALLA